MQEAEKCVESRAITDVHTAHAMVHLLMAIYSKGQAWRSFCCITSNLFAINKLGMGGPAWRSAAWVWICAFCGERYQDDLGVYWGECMNVWICTGM